MLNQSRSVSGLVLVVTELDVLELAALQIVGEADQLLPDILGKAKRLGSRCSL